jgi:uncharacterized UPF0160 family protein
MKAPTVSTGEESVIWVHHDPYHADELLAVAALIDLFPGSNIKRSRDPKDGEFANFSVDVGGRYDPSQGCFDHHHATGVSHPEGIPKASAGLVWQEFGESYVTKQALRLARGKRHAISDLIRWPGLSAAIRSRDVIRQVAEMVRKSVILPIDVWDNGKRPGVSQIPSLHFSGIIHSMSSAGESFSEALLFTQTALRAQTAGALARVLRTRCLVETTTFDLSGRVCCQVKPYSMSWVRKSLPEAGDATVAYHCDGDHVYFVLADEHGENQLLKNKNRVTAAEFEALFP